MKDLPSFNLHLPAIVAEMRTPLAELNILARAGRTEEVRELTQHILSLFESFLYAQKLEVGSENLPLSQYSLSVITTEILRKMQVLASFYNIELNLRDLHRQSTNVYLNKEVFERATHSLLYALILSLQNQATASLEVRLGTSPQPSLRFFSRELSIGREHFVFQTKTTRSGVLKPGYSYGFPLAHFLYKQLNSPLRFLSNQHGSGLTVGFKTTQQLLLTEAL